MFAKALLKNKKETRMKRRRHGREDEYFEANKFLSEEDVVVKEKFFVIKWSLFNG
jgi:hypothetical protein